MIHSCIHLLIHQQSLQWLSHCSLTAHLTTQAGWADICKFLLHAVFTPSEFLIKFMFHQAPQGNELLHIGTLSRKNDEHSHNYKYL